MGEMATPFLREVLPSAVTISPETLDIGGYLTTQNVRDGHIMGGGGGGRWSIIHFHIQKLMVFKIIAKKTKQQKTTITPIKNNYKKQKQTNKTEHI